MTITTYQKHYPDLGSTTLSDVISLGRKPVGVVVKCRQFPQAGQTPVFSFSVYLFFSSPSSCLFHFNSASDCTHRLVSNYSYNTGQSAPVCSKSHRADSRLACASSGEILVAAAERHPARNVLVRWRLRRQNLPRTRTSVSFRISADTQTYPIP